MGYVRIYPDTPDHYILESVGKVDEWPLYSEVARESGIRYTARNRYRGYVDTLPHLLSSLQARNLFVTLDDSNGFHVEQLLASRIDRLVSTEVDDHRLYPFQRVGSRFLRSRDAALCADEMGLGKTIQTLLALPPNRPVIVVCPASLKRNWLAEFRKWRPDYKAFVLDEELVGTLPGYAMITSYGRVPDTNVWGTDRAPFLSDETLLVIDEIHYCKNDKAKRTRRIRKLVSQCSTVWGLTGTPILNQPVELWGILTALRLDAEVFGDFEGFASSFGGTRVGRHFEYGAPKAEVIKRLERVTIRRERRRVLPQLPDKTYQSISVPLPTKGARATIELLDTILEKLGRSAIEEMARAERVSGAMMEARAALARIKLPFALQYIETFENAHTPVVFFSAHKDPVVVMGQREGWEAITGDTPANDRQRIVQDFQDGKLKGIALTIRAGGVGFTLTRSAHAVFLDLDWTPSGNEQAEDRLARIGQKNAVQIIRLVAEHELDEILEDVLSRKSGIIDATIKKMDAIDDPVESKINELKKVLTFIEASKGD